MGGRAARTNHNKARAGRRAGLCAAALVLAAMAPAAAETVWEYAKFPDPDTGDIRHTVQTKIDYDGAVAALAFVCVRGNLLLTVVATWPIAPILRYRFPPEAPRWIMGRAPVPSSVVFQGEEARKLFATALIRQALLVRIPGPRTVVEKTLDLQPFREKAKPLVEACGEK
ncbi:MAG: hypothetical protein KIT16_05435 [Rhodospirillaceae bacterium]|nr:hypothetical protein [Rhodospirillaceae bacterium]